MAKKTAEEDAGARETLRTVFPRHSYVTTLVRHVSSSGMTRWVSVLAIDGEGRIWDASGLVARATARTFDPQRGGVKVGGCGFDAGLEIVMDLSRVLYDDSYALNHNRL